MRIPKDLFWNGVPIDTKYIMAQNGYATLPEVDTSNYHPTTEDDVQASVWNPGQYDITNAKHSNPYDIQVDRSNYTQPDVYSQFPKVPPPVTIPSPKPPNKNPNNIGDYINTGLGIADSLIPGERIQRNYVTQPLPVYNPHPYGTGSQAIMEYGGEMEEAKDGHWIQKAINPAHKGYCTPMTKSTCTGHRKAFAMRAKHHNLEDGGEIENYNYGGDMEEAASGIHIKPENRGKFTAYKKRTGKTTEEALHSKDPHVRKMANFARNAKKWHHGENGAELPLYDPNIQYAHGGDLSPAKAAEILHDGTANGHPLTDKQRRFMGWKAHQKAPDGTQLPANAVKNPNGTGELATPQSRGDAYMVDAINQTLITGQRPKNINGYSTPQEQQILNDAYIWRQANDRKDPKANIEGYFNRPVDQNNPLHMYRARLNTIGHGAVSMYNTTPNIDLQQAQPPAPSPSLATMENGGYTEGSVHDLSEEEIAKLLKSGHRIEYL